MPRSVMLVEAGVFFLFIASAGMAIVLAPTHHALALGNILAMIAAVLAHPQTPYG